MSQEQLVTLGLNVDHVATVRQARDGQEPNLIQATREGIQGGAKGITTHLREDRRHIQDEDVFKLKRAISVPLNLEMSIQEGIVRVACKLKPAKACFVPEKREELTTEGGLDVVREKGRIARAIDQLQTKGVIVSLFVDPVPKQIQAAYDVGTDFIELHTGCYANAKGSKQTQELRRLSKAACLAHSLGLGVNAGHGLNYENVKPIAQLPFMEELNIGHAVVSRAIFVGMKEAVREMCTLIRSACRHGR
ncbi:MAG: pyridoxine 5'-phosphate synthase [Candidatus Omnitrophica bacterium]|nr:pyridoxine 5'-phosphate synthase [Candidatus Omnitrophota bacterium]